jgi:hypothetical protein
MADARLLDGAQAEYYRAAAAAKALGAASGVTGVGWDDADELRNALIYNDEMWADDKVANDPLYAENPQLLEEARRSSGLAISEHGPEAMANARQGAETGLAYIQGDPAAMEAVTDVVFERGRWYIERADGITLPVASNVAMEMGQARAQARNREVNDMFRTEQGLRPDGGAVPLPPPQGALDPQAQREALNLGRMLTPAL